jgi:glyoxylase-like metal-dependent hydrolase (beta-lactamase superfamily II)
MSKLEVERLTLGYFMVNCYIVYISNSKDAVIIDPGADPLQILDFINRKELKIKYIINTHGHYDHIGANNEIKSVLNSTIYIHRLDEKMLSSPTKNLSLFLGKLYKTEADVVVEEGDEFKIDNKVFKILHTPGHTPGSMSLMVDDYLFCGDLVFKDGIGRTDLFGGSSRDLALSIKNKILILNDDVKLYPGHGPETTVKYIKENNYMVDYILKSEKLNL